MWKDEIVEDIKKRSERYAKEMKYDIRAIAEDIQKHAETSGVKEIAAVFHGQKKRQAIGKKAVSKRS